MSSIPDRNPDICQLIRSCGQQAEQMATQQFEVELKGPGDFVTSIDAALDRRLFSQFSTWFPQDGVITEENAASKQQYSTDYQRLWCIDPLDGTSDFIQRSQEYAVMVGLLERQQPIAGWVYAPAYDCLYYGGRDWGMFQAIAGYPPIPLTVTEPPAPTSGALPILIGHQDWKRFGGAIIDRIPSVRFYSVGSFGLKVLEVVQGRAGLYLYLNRRVKVWDTAAPLALAIAAGLVCCDLDGQPIQFSPDALNLDTLAHLQPILVGWPDYVEGLRPQLKAAVGDVLQTQSR